MTSDCVPARVGLAFLALILVFGVFTPQASAQASVKGQWSTLPTSMPINPIHSALLNNGKILIVAGSGNCPPSQSGCPLGPPYGPGNNSGALLYDPGTGNITQFSVAWDMFCNAILVLSDGRAFINGGSIQYDPFFGQTKSSIFDPASNTFTDAQNMAHGRWYPTVTNLGNGTFMTFSGQDDTTGNTNKAVEIYTVGTGWSQQYTASWTPPLYPRMHLLPNGKVFYSGSGPTSMLFDPSSHTWTTGDTTIYGGTRTYGSSVLFPLTPANGYDPQVMILGGGSPATSTTEVIDLGASNPTWRSGPSMSQGRIEMNAVLLPNGKILAMGGSVNDEDPNTASLNADLYDPASDSFSSAGANTYPRLYHSIALLLPDASVWLAGGNPTRGSYESHLENYKPPYLFNSNGTLATRPTITSLPATIAWNGAFSVSTPDAANISSVVLMRPGASTHSFDMEQRMVGLSFSAGSGTLTVTAPPNGNIAPPGYYMLFLLNSSGVPSVAKFTKLGATGGNPAPTVTSISPTSGTANGGTSVTVGGTGFLAGATLSLGGTAASGVTVVNSTKITGTTAAHSTGAVSVQVTNSDSKSGSLAGGFTYTSPGNPAPTVTSISPTSGTTKGGTPVTVSGTGFLAGATLSLGGTAASGVTVVNSTTITGTTAAHSAGAVNVVVTNSDGKSGTLTGAFTYTNPAPTVLSIRPNSGTANGGTAVTIAGTGFLAGATVSVGGTAATATTVVSSTSITATTPVHSAGSVDVVVTNPDTRSGTLASSYTFTSSMGLGVPSGDPTSATVLDGKAAAYTLSLGGAGASGSANLSCTGAPTGANCSLPPSQAFSATAATTFSVNVTTTSRTIVASVPSYFGPKPWSWSFAMGMLGIVVLPGMKASKRRMRRYLWLPVLACLLFLVSCGGGGNIGGSSAGGQQVNPHGTPAGTYTLTVTATSASMTQTVPLTLIVQ